MITSRWEHLAYNEISINRAGGIEYISHDGKGNIKRFILPWRNIYIYADGHGGRISQCV